ncbi:MAG: glutamine-hydrolyzing carbamoyl-phosphate synthase small subunit [Actinobacteria bacterium]|nr:glutamine-hydrolyzing carbamoyl-phosphate synthase small subunit [Actinomycetota bacterium]
MTDLVLEDETVYTGEMVGSPGVAAGELCFTTAMTGYQESVTDPSYSGQVLVFSYPLAGNYGVEPNRSESDLVHTRAVIMRRSRPVWSEWLRTRGVVALDEVDTRSLVRHIREHGAMRCAVGDASTEDLLALALSEPHIDYERSLLEPDLAMPPLALEVGVQQPWRTGSGPRVVVVDLGTKRSVTDALAKQGLEVVVVPASFDADTILDLRPRAVLIGNGPGDPAQLVDQIGVIRALLGQVPVLGICLGHQLLGLALGMRTFKLAYGHRGTNHPVRHRSSTRVLVTSHNHGFAVEPGDSAEISFVSLNDGTVEGIAGDGYSSVQFHPEAAPGTSDASWFFEEIGETCRGVPISAAS